MSTLSASLKESIRDRHSEMEEAPYVKALMDGTLPINCYIAQLKALAIIHGTIERELAQSELQELKGLLLPRPSRFGHLRTDIMVLKAHTMPDCIRAVNQALRIAEEIRLTRIEKPEGLIGFLYVLEGTTLGNRVHLSDLINTFGDRIRGATNYYEGYGDRTIYYWDEFRGFLNGLSNHDTIIASAHRLFDLLEPLYIALYPVNEEGWGYLATTLNPEAGRHPVPSDTLEIQAALLAGYRCLQEFPYLYERYQERGKAFTYSDAAWLVTLSRLPKGECLRQVPWLTDSNRFPDKWIEAVHNILTLAKGSLLR